MPPRGIHIKPLALMRTGERPLQVAKIVTLVLRAARLADADEFITNLRHGYGTIVGSSGRLISGGQKQRVALARALVKDPAILILDEATASLDSRSEERIQRAISNISSHQNIGHRITWLRLHHGRN